MKSTEANSNTAANLNSWNLQEQDQTAPGHSLHAAPLITIFSMPKPFGNPGQGESSDQSNTDLIQRNAIRSWVSLPNVEVILVGDEYGIAETAQELGARHFGNVEFNEQGTPLVSSAFEIAHRESNSPYLVYCNADVILLEDFVKAIETIHKSDLKQFVAFGRRTDLVIDKEIEFDSISEIEALLTDCKQNGVPATNACKEYFVFNKDLYKSIPRFAVGRGNWDSWMIHSAKQRGIAAINFSEMVTIIHQAHDYSHFNASRYECYVSGKEAEENRRLAGGRHLISGSTATWRLTLSGLVREKPFLLSRSFWADVPRFMKLMSNLMTGK